MQLRVHQLLPTSQTNGPGRRAVVWLQGCALGCPGCFNPETHDRAGGTMMDMDAVVDWLKAQNQVEGLTLSGGEPLQQRRSVECLLERVRAETQLSTLVFTGYSWAEIQAMRAPQRLLALIDVLVAGRYDQTQRLASGLIGSANKSVHFLSDRYGPADLIEIPQAEVVITSVGEVWLSGIDPLRIYEAAG